jgi:hypothetical protein
MAFDMHDAAERATGNDTAHFDGGGPEAFVLADADGYASGFAGINGALCVGAGQ